MTVVELVVPVGVVTAEAPSRVGAETFRAEVVRRAFDAQERAFLGLPPFLPTRGDLALPVAGV